MRKLLGGGEIEKMTGDALAHRDPRTRDRIEAELRKRYGADYQVITTGSAQEALSVLGQLNDEQR